LVDESAAPTLYHCGEDIGEWGRAALDSVGDGPIVVVGNSIGGSCALEVARLAPNKVKALVLVGAKPGHRRDPELPDEATGLIGAEGLRAAWQRYCRPCVARRSRRAGDTTPWHSRSRRRERPRTTPSRRCRCCRSAYPSANLARSRPRTSTVGAPRSRAT